MKDEKVAQLSREDREAIIDQERSVDVAKANVDAAKGAAQQAHEFQDLVNNEVDVAKAQSEAAAKGADIKDRADKRSASDANAKRQVAARQVTAAEAKAEYAAKLVDVREAEVEQREAEYTLTKARLERSKDNILQRRGLGEGIDRQKIIDAERDAEQKRAEANQKVVQLQGYADASKKNWDNVQQQYEASAKSTQADEKSAQVPPPAKYIPQASVKERAAKDEVQ